MTCPWIVLVKKFLYKYNVYPYENGLRVRVISLFLGIIGWLHYEKIMTSDKSMVYHMVSDSQYSYAPWGG